MEINKTSLLIGLILFLGLIPTVSTLIDGGQHVYSCPDDTYPYLNVSDNLCYNSTVADYSTDTPRDSGFNAVEFTIMGLVVIVMILGMILGLADGFGLKRKQ